MYTLTKIQQKLEKDTKSKVVVIIMVANFQFFTAPLLKNTNHIISKNGGPFDNKCRQLREAQ